MSAVLRRNKAPQSQLINPSLIPPAFQGIYDEIHIGANGSIKWGWRQWSLLTPRLHKHIQKHGRAGLAGAVDKAQRAVLSKQHHRPLGALYVACADNQSKPSYLDVVALVNFVAGMQSTSTAPAARAKPVLKVVPPPAVAQAPETMLTNDEFMKLGGIGNSLFYGYQKEGLLPPHTLKDKRTRLYRLSDVEAFLAQRAKFSARGNAFKKHLLAVKRREEREQLVQQTLASVPTPEPIQAVQAPAATAAASPYADRLEGLFAMPVAAFLPLLKEGLKDLVRGLMQEERQATRNMLQELFTGHTPKVARRASIKEAKPEVDTVETVTQKAILAGSVLQMAQDTLLAREQELRELQEQLKGKQPAAHWTRTDEGGTVDVQLHIPEPIQEVQPSEPTPEPQKALVVHGLDEMETVAKALGMPHVKRPTVVVVGLHPKVMQELEKAHSREYRFDYIKQDHFTRAEHLPASTDGLILSRKKLNSELIGAVRRYAIPFRSIANSLPAAEWALKQIFEEAQP